MRSDLYRAVNHRIAELTASSFGPVEFLCECGGAACLHTLLSLDRREYERINAVPGQYLLAPGHERPGTTVVRETSEYLVARDAVSRATSAR